MEFVRVSVWQQSVRARGFDPSLKRRAQSLSGHPFRYACVSTSSLNLPRLMNVAFSPRRSSPSVPVHSPAQWSWTAACPSAAVTIVCPIPNTRCKLLLIAFPGPGPPSSTPAALSRRAALPLSCSWARPWPPPRKEKLILRPPPAGACAAVLEDTMADLLLFLRLTATTAADSGTTERGGHSPSRFQPDTHARIMSLRLMGQDGWRLLTTTFS